jgi:hypothetical protein
MSRTNRNVEHIHSGALRHPHTENERSQLDVILHDEELVDYSLSKMNHMKSRKNNLVSDWDDITVSAYYETRHQK